MILMGQFYNGDSTVVFFLYALRTHPALIRYIPHQVKVFLYELKQIGRSILKEFFQLFSRYRCLCPGSGILGQKATENTWLEMGKRFI